MKKYALTLGAGLCGTDGAGDDGVENLKLTAIGISQQFHDFLRVGGPHIGHCDENTADGQVWVDLPLYFADGPHELFHAFQREVMGHHGDDKRVGG